MFHQVCEMHHWISTGDTMHVLARFLTITMTSQWVGWRLKSPASGLFTQPFIRGAEQKKTSKPRVTGLCAGNSPGTGEFPHKWPLTRKLLISIWWRHHANPSWPGYHVFVFCTLQWRHNEHDGVSNHRRLECLLKRLFRRRWKKTPALRVTGLCEGNSPVTGEFPAQRASNAENVSIDDIIMTDLKVYNKTRWPKRGYHI